MSKDSGSKTQKVQSSTAPWGPQATRWQTSLGDLDRLRTSGALRINPYPGQTVAGASPETEAFWSGTAGRAQAGSPLNAMSRDYVSRILDPSYLTEESSGISDVLDMASNDVNARFAMGGRTFSGAHAGALGKQLGGIRYQDFARRAGEQQAAAQFAPQLAREDYYDLGQLGQVGGQREAYMQDQINADIDRYNKLQQAPINELALYQQLIGGNLGGTTQGTQPRQAQPGTGSQLAQVLASLAGSYFGSGGTL